MISSTSEPGDLELVEVDLISKVLRIQFMKCFRVEKYEHLLVCIPDNHELSVNKHAQFELILCTRSRTYKSFHNTYVVNSICSACM